MIRFSSLLGPADLAGSAPRDVEVRSGMTAGDAIRESGDELADSVRVWIDGVEIDSADPIPAGAATLHYGPRVHGVETAVLLAISIGASYGLQQYSAARLAEKQRAIAAQQQSNTSRWNIASTTYGDGYKTPLVVGRTRLVGHAIHVDVESVGLDERLRMVLELGWGPFHSIAGVKRDADLFGPNLAQQLTGLSVNGVSIQADTAGNLLAGAGVRLGSVNQQPFPPRYSRATAILAVGYQFTTGGQRTVAFVPDTKATAATLTFDAPSGIYAQSPGGGTGNYRVDIRYRWRPRGIGAAFSSWLPSAAGFPVAGSDNTPRSVSRTIDLGTGVSRPAGFDGFEFEVERITTDPTSPDTYVSTVVLSRISYTAGIRQSYPRVAMLALDLFSSAQFSGGRPQAEVDVEGMRVRMWDSAAGLSDELYEAPTAGAFAGIAQVVKPGENPAWQAAALLTDEDVGAGPLRYVPMWSAFRNWADYCDEFELRSAFVYDQGQPSLDALQSTVFSAGRAILRTSGNLIFPIYWFRESHGRGTNFVPARAPRALITAGNCEQWVVTYAPSTRRATRRTTQIRSEDNGFQLTPIRIDDPSANTNDPSKLSYVPMREEETSLAAVTSPTQAKRHLWWTLQLEIEGDRELEVVVPVEFVTFELGANFLFQAPKYRPFLDDGLAIGARTDIDLVAGTAYLRVDRFVDLAGVSPSTGYYGAAVHYGGTVLHTTLYLDKASYAPGRLLTLKGALTLPHDIPKGSRVVIGKRELADPANPPPAATEWTSTEFSIQADMRVRIRGTRYAAAIYDEPPASVLDQPSPIQLLATVPPTVPGAVVSGDATVDASAVEIKRAATGEYVIGWIPPAGLRNRGAVVSIRENASAEWSVLGRVSGSSIVVESLHPDRSDYRIDVRVAPYIDELGVASPTATVHRVHVPEFCGLPIETPARLDLKVTGDNIVATWPAVDGADYYEVRRGDEWDGAPVVAKTTETELRIGDLAAGTRRYHVRARRKFGGWSPSSATATAIWSKREDAIAIDAVDVATGTLTLDAGMENTPDATLAKGYLTGSATVEVKVDSPFAAWWTAEVDYFESMPGLDSAHPLAAIPASDDGYFRGTYTREPSDRFPGVDLDSEYVGDPPLAASVRGSGAGRNTSVVVDVRWDKGSGTFTAWERFRAQRMRAERAEFRITARRRSTDYQVTLTAFRAQVTT